MNYYPIMLISVQAKDIIPFIRTLCRLSLALTQQNINAGTHSRYIIDMRAPSSFAL